ncbi:MAG: septum formation initiator family protein [Actinomycetia bacterium]|nr:septum formation initiator family protein [Actinomycetes bacterium]
MAEGRRGTRGSSGPGRATSRPGSPRQRRTSRPSVAHQPEPEKPQTLLPEFSLGITRRAIALAVVLAILALSYIGSLRLYVQQQQEIAVAKQQIAQRSASVARLSDELKRWDDPDYVKAQARDRLGWVVPGEVGYRVIGADGQVLSGQVGSIKGPHDSENQAWYDKLWSSVQAADQPAPAAPPRKATEIVTPPPSAPSPSRSKR